MSNPAQVGSYIPSTNIWDPSIIYGADNISPELKEILVRMYQNLNLMAINVNLKDTGYYDTLPFVNSQLFFPNPMYNSSTPTTAAYRQVNRQVINFGTLPNATTKSVPHNIICNPATSFTRIYGAASDQTGLNYIPLPYASPTLAHNIEINCDGTNVNVITGSNRTNFTVTYVILEWLTN